MSEGYYRKGKPNRLRGLRIDECSLVDKGAGHDCTVQLIKRERNEAMNPTPMQFAEATVKAVNDGRMSQFGMNVIMQAMARDAGGMAKFLDTEVGKVFLRPKESRTPIAQEYDLQKSEGYDKVRTVRYYQSKPGDNGDGLDESGWSANVDWNDDKQATAAYRAEKARKAESAAGDAARSSESDVGSHQGENTRGRRRVSGASINPKPLSP
jgi:hypothetical protein